MEGWRSLAGLPPPAAGKNVAYDWPSVANGGLAAILRFLWRRLWLHERQGVGAGVAPAAVTERVVSRRTEWRCDRVPSAPFGVRATGEGDDRASLAHVDAQWPNATRHIELSCASGGRADVPQALASATVSAATAKFHVLNRVGS
jgi:hypothetical protein